MKHLACRDSITERVVSDLPDYTSILAQCFSPPTATSQDLIVCDSKGRITSLNVESVLNRLRETADSKIESRVCDLKTPIFSAAATREHLVVGTESSLIGFQWSDLSTPQWKMPVQAESCNALCEVVAISHVDGSKVYFATSDGAIHTLDTRAQKVTQKNQRAHLQYIYDMTSSSESGVVGTCSEDGQCKMWDLRDVTNNVATLKPSENSDLARPISHGKHITSMDMANDWVACGGGPMASIWHLRNLSLLSGNLHQTDVEISAIHINPESIYLGGNKGMVYRTTHSGDVMACMEVRSQQVYSLAVPSASSPQRIPLLSCGGSTSWIDICNTDLHYRQQAILI